MCVWLQIKKSTYFIIQLIFVTIHGPTTLFSTIHESHYTILVTFTFIYSTFSKKKFSFSKISGSQIDLKFLHTHLQCLDFRGFFFLLSEKFFFFMNIIRKSIRTILLLYLYSPKYEYFVGLE